MSDNKITQDQLEPNVMEELESGIGDLSTLSTENKDSLVAAVTEIYGKNVIADAIGEPLAVTDTFSEMGSEINSLLSSFKTNMMNSGVTVESGDKFKQLIEKIKGLTEGEGEGNKGIKYAEGIIDVENVTLDNDKWLTYEIPYNIDFDPTILLICISKWGMSSTNKNDYILVICDKFSNSEDTATRFKVPNMTETYLECYITNATSTGCTLNYYLTSSTWNNIGGFSYCAIGVGEEDTTLRDSLASILQEEGVIVTEEDDMASLITKVDEEFDRKNASSGLDIISATELPATGKENQICVITNNPTDNFRISNLQTDILNDGNIYLKLGSGSGPSSGNITIGNTVQTIYHVDGIYQNNTKLKSYVYQNGNWIEFTKTGIDIMVNGSYTVDSETYGTLKERSGTSSSITFTDGNGLWMNHGLVSASRSGFMHTYLTKKIDISGFTKVKVTLKDMDYGGSASTNMITTLHFFDSAPTNSLLTEPDPDDDYPSKVQNIGRSDFTSKNIVFDISDMTGSYYLDFEIYTPSDSSGYYVDVRLTDFSIE